MGRMRIVLTTDDGDQEEHYIPATWVICSTCGGDGAHSLAIGAITEEDREQNWSHEEWEDYLDGAYDRPCEECDGSGKVQIPANPDNELVRRWEEQEYNRRAEDRADARTLFMETGGAMGSW